MTQRGLWKIASRKRMSLNTCDRHLNSPYKMATILNGDENNKHDELDTQHYLSKWSLENYMGQ